MTRSRETLIADWTKCLEAIGYDTDTARRMATEAVSCTEKST